MDTQNKTREHLLNFNPEVYKFKNFKRRDLLCEFNAGEEEYSFNEFIKNESEKYSDNGDGATYVVCNTEFDELSGKWEVCDVIGRYFIFKNQKVPKKNKV